MTPEEIIAKLREMRKRYEDDGWLLEDLRCELEEIFMALEDGE